jgi:hypothetical protein
MIKNDEGAIFRMFFLRDTAGGVAITLIVGVRGLNLFVCVCVCVCVWAILRCCQDLDYIAMTDELEGSGPMYYPGIYRKGMGNTIKNLSYDKRWSGRDSNQATPEWKSRSLPQL